MLLHSRGVAQETISLRLRIDGVAGPSVSFPASGGSSRQCVSVSISDDQTVEHDETLSVELNNTDSGDLTLLPSSILISIEDDDGEWLAILQTRCGGSKDIPRRGGREDGRIGVNKDIALPDQTLPCLLLFDLSQDHGFIPLKVLSFHKFHVIEGTVLQSIPCVTSVTFAPIQF